VEQPQARKNPICLGMIPLYIQSDVCAIAGLSLESPLTCTGQDMYPYRMSGNPWYRPVAPPTWGDTILWAGPQRWPQVLQQQLIALVTLPEDAGCHMEGFKQGLRQRCVHFTGVLLLKPCPGQPACCLKEDAHIGLITSWTRLAAGAPLLLGGHQFLQCLLDTMRYPCCCLAIAGRYAQDTRQQSYPQLLFLSAGAGRHGVFCALCGSQANAQPRCLRTCWSDQLGRHQARLAITVPDQRAGHASHHALSRAVRGQAPLVIVVSLVSFSEV
jgi:hypothetical protein